MASLTTDTHKVQSAVAYLARRLSPGKVKLFKLLYLADFTAYVRLGHSITTDTYENFDMGPVPVTLWTQFNKLTRDCVEVVEVETGVIPEQQMRPRPGFRPTLAPEEEAILDEIVDRYGAMSGNQLKAYTHETIPYRATQRKETIPYGLAAYLDYQKPTRADLDRLLQDDALMDDLRRALQ